MSIENGYDIDKLYDDNIVKKTGNFLRITSAHRIYPAFFIAGVQKGGTTSLCKYLEQHPQIISPQRKDVYFFNNELNYAKGVEWYKSHFAHRLYKLWYDKVNGVDSITFDGTPNYFDAPEAPEKLYSDFPNAKVILLLRNPIDRAYSNYQMACRFGFEKLSFERALELEDKRLEEESKYVADCPYHSYVYQRLTYRKRGVYIRYIKSWMNLFKDNLLVLKSEQLFLQPEITFKLITNFLNLHGSYEIRFDIFNKGSYEAKMKSSTRKILSDFYKPYNEELYDFLNVNYEWD
ncbi:MAG: sulfotransferase [Chitinophagales bacterium]